jgi:hypothetical protein
MYRDSQTDPTANSAMMEVGYIKQFDNAKMKFSVGGFSERDRWLGNSAVGSTQQSNNFTQFVGLNASTNIVEGLEAYGSLYHGTTFARANTEFINNLRPVQSYSWTIGLEQKLSKHDFVGIMMYQPVSAYRAIANTTVASGMDANFNPTNNGTVNMAADTKELRSGLYYKIVDTKSNTNVLAFFEHRQNYMGQEGLKTNLVGTSVNYRF